MNRTRATCKPPTITKHYNGSCNESTQQTKNRNGDHPAAAYYIVFEAAKLQTFRIVKLNFHWKRIGSISYLFGSLRLMRYLLKIRIWCQIIKRLTKLIDGTNASQIVCKRVAELQSLVKSASQIAGMNKILSQKTAQNDTDDAKSVNRAKLIELAKPSTQKFAKWRDINPTVISIHNPPV